MSMWVFSSENFMAFESRLWTIYWRRMGSLSMKFGTFSSILSTILCFFLSACILFKLMTSYRTSCGFTRSFFILNTCFCMLLMSCKSRMLNFIIWLQNLIASSNFTISGRCSSFFKRMSAYKLIVLRGSVIWLDMQLFANTIPALCSRSY